MAAIDLRGVTRRFGSTTAVDDVTLQIADGEFFCLVGPSGCGKTTMLRLLAGFERPDHGDIVVGRERFNDLEPQSRNVGVVFQSYALFPTMTVWSNIAYGLRVRKLPKSEISRRIRDVLQLVELAGLEQRRPAQLSGGQQQRVALARALVIQPKLLLLDEPLSSLDAKLRVGIRRQIRRIQRELSITTLLVTHDQEEAMALADRIGVMHAGRLQQVGTPTEIYFQPRTAFVADFIGQSNLFDGQVERVTSDTALVALGQTLRLPLPLIPDVRAGDPVWCSLRPEALIVNGPSPGKAESVPIAGTVSFLEFLGNVVRVELSVDALPRPVLVEMSPHGHLPCPGTRLQVELDLTGVSYGLLHERPPGGEVTEGGGSGVLP
jgi:ABC-type Fe3+/spermidine/putrescine transport system ATPase subunit